MGSIKLKPKAIKVVCNNCFRITTGYRDENGVVKYQCTRCVKIYNRFVKN